MPTASGRGGLRPPPRPAHRGEALASGGSAGRAASRHRQVGRRRHTPRALTAEAGRAAFSFHKGRVGAGRWGTSDLVANGFKFLQTKKGSMKHSFKRANISARAGWQGLGGGCARAWGGRARFRHAADPRGRPLWKGGALPEGKRPSYLPITMWSVTCPPGPMELPGATGAGQLCPSCLLPPVK